VLEVPAKSLLDGMSALVLSRGYLVVYNVSGSLLMEGFRVFNI
jgi:hypothetical protein